MIFGVDWDGTWAAAPALWDAFARAAKAAGHVVLVVTNRSPTAEPIEAGAVMKWVPVVYCDGRPKRDACLELGIRVDVWVDDNPVLVDFGLPGLRELERRNGKGA